jgi:hypothetical protein
MGYPSLGAGGTKVNSLCAAVWCLLWWRQGGLVLMENHIVFGQFNGWKKICVFSSIGLHQLYFTASHIDTTDCHRSINVFLISLVRGQIEPFLGISGGDWDLGWRTMVMWQRNLPVKNGSMCSGLTGGHSKRGCGHYLRGELKSKPNDLFFLWWFLS